MRKIIAAAGCLVLLSFVVSGYFYLTMPDRIVTHWGFGGQPDGYMPKSVGLFIAPLISVFILLLLLALPRIDPLKMNVSKFRKQFDLFIFVIVAFLFYIHLLVVAWGLGARFSMVQLMSPAFAALFYSVGVLCEKSKRNWFIGIRTPWTMSSDRVWDRTHKRGGKMLKAVAVLMLLGIAFQDYALFLVLGLAVAVFVYLFVYSYIVYKKK